jgi:nicotinate-nucleotide adenylyltransferase
MVRLGVLGGTFNPVHVGHVRQAIEMAEALAFGRVEFIPAARPPHKAGEGMLPFEVRAGLLELAVEGMEGFGVNRMEEARPGPSYTCDTLAELAAKNPGSDIHFIMGATDLLNLHLWKRGPELADLASLAVSTREDLGRPEVEAYLAGRPEFGWTPDGPWSWRSRAGRSIRLVDIPRLDISASFVRDRFRRGSCLRFIIPPAVEAGLERIRDLAVASWS